MNIVITGGASGLGKAITRKLASQKENRVLFTFSKSQISAEKLEKEHRNAEGFKCDFSKPDEVEALKRQLSTFDVDVLINNAYNGQFLKTYFHKINITDFLIDFNNNIIPTISINQEVINYFRKKKQGKIITVLSSALVNIPPIGSASYLAGKAYLEGLTRIWAAENIKFNITSNSISPSFMLTNLTRDIDARVIEGMIENHPGKRLLTVDEVADKVEYLINDNTRMNGVNFVLDSGNTVKICHDI